jgi:glucose/arabinose dehydrogenase
MMSRPVDRVLLTAGLVLLLSAAGGYAAEKPQPVASGLVNPESVCYGPQGLLYVTEIGEFDKAGDGKVSVIKDGKPETFATGLDDPKGIVFHKDELYVTDKDKIVKINASGKTSVFQPASAFPKPPLFLNDIAVDSGNGIFLVTDSGDLKGKGGALYRIDVRLNKIEMVADTTTIPELNTPNGVAFDGESSALLADFGSGALYSVRFHDKKAQKVAEGMEGADGLIWDGWGHLYITSWKTGKVFGIPRPGEKPVLMSEAFESAADCCLSADGREFFIPDMKAGKLLKLSTQIPGWEVDESASPVQVQLAFPNIKWTGWDDGSESGKINPFRPIVLTHAGDGSNRIFVVEQHGVIHSFKNDDAVKESKVFLDISDRVSYLDKQNEEGFLGLAFHPKFKQNGEFFVFYTESRSKLVNVLSRFRVKKDDPTVADPASEEILLKIEKPYWNHDGGCIVFGPDGYLYISHGDGGAGGDPQKNGQNLKTLLGKVLRIDVDKKADGKNYAIPKDNPFVSEKDARPEIWAYGLRNVWRMAFDRETGVLWGGDVGQNVWEEIIFIERGGNYGWSNRESLHPFGSEGVWVNPKMIEPIWEYAHHLVGNSITGGAVYRGKKVPELQGQYLYADYVTTKMFALRYDAKKKRVTENHPVENPKLAVTSFGEDEEGELYALVVDARGRGIFRFTKSGSQKPAGK